ncbi:MAG: PTS fructose transporter subunit IIA [Methylotenera sp.]|nr:MAG: PTS fructose transporter subunit IIA [Methylotenera sp.]
MIGILIIAHGSLGESLLDCAKHVLGKEPQQMAYLAVKNNDDLSTVLPKAKEMVAQLNTGSGVLVLSDMYGATPCNTVGKLLKPGIIEGVAGVNLPMLVRTLNYRDISLRELVEKAVSGGREGVVHFDEKNCDHYE